MRAGTLTLLTSCSTPYRKPSYDLSFHLHVHIRTVVSLQRWRHFSKAEKPACRTERFSWIKVEKNIAIYV